MKYIGICLGYLAGAVTGGIGVVIRELVFYNGFGNYLFSAIVFATVLSVMMCAPFFLVGRFLFFLFGRFMRRDVTSLLLWHQVVLWIAIGMAVPIYIYGMDGELDEGLLAAAHLIPFGALAGLAAYSIERRVFRTA